MRSGHETSSRIRHDAAALLLGVFLLATQFGPVVHLATHRPDHTHGPDLAVLAAADHDAAHRAGRPHDHHDAARDRRPDAHGQSIPPPPPPEHGEQAGADHAPDAGDASSGDIPIDDHGRESVAHFGLALLQGPPPPIVPPPSEAIAAPADATPRWRSVLPHPQPPARGPPAPHPPQLHAVSPS